MRILKLLASLATVLLVVGGVSALQAEMRRGPRVRFEGRHPAMRGHEVLCYSVEASGPLPKWVRGYVENPRPLIPTGNLPCIYGQRVRKGSQWVDAGPGWCGTGAGLLKVEPGTRSYFSVLVPSGRWQELQVGLSWSPRPGPRRGLATSWSEPVTRSVVDGRRYR